MLRRALTWSVLAGAVAAAAAGCTAPGPSAGGASASVAGASSTGGAPATDAPTTGTPTAPASSAPATASPTATDTTAPSATPSATYRLPKTPYSRLTQEHDEGIVHEGVLARGIVTYENAGKKGIIQVNLLGIQPGTYADLKPFDPKGTYRRQVPYYVTVVYSNVGITTWKKPDLGLMLLVSSGDTQGTSVQFPGPTPFCPHNVPAVFAPGDQVVSCVIGILPKGADLDRITYYGDFESRPPVAWALSEADVPY